MAMGMTKGEKIGQLLIFGFDGPNLNHHAQEIIKNCAPGGVTLCRRNFLDKNQIAKLIIQLQALNKQYHPASPPLFIACDLNCGLDTGMSIGLTPFPTGMAFGGVKKFSDAAKAHEIISQELYSLGFNMLFGPCLDVNDNSENPFIGLKPFSSDPDLVSKISKGVIQGIMDGGLIPVISHFPGTGGAEIDPRIELPTVKRSMSQMDRIDLLPFRTAIKKTLPAIMISNVHYKAIDPQEILPASCSYNTVTKLLKNKLGFNGLTIADDFEMAGIRRNVGLETALRKAITAGVDLFVISQSIQHQLDAVEFLKESVSTGEMHLSKIEKSVDRIIAMKYELFNRQIKIKRKPGSKASLTLSKQLFKESIKVIKKTRGFIPIKGKEIQYIYPDHTSLEDVSEGFSFPDSFASELRKRKIKATGFEYPIEPTIAEIEKIKKELKPECTTILFTYRQEQNASRKRLYGALASRNLIQIGIAEPNDNHSKSAVYIATFGHHDFAMQALAQVIFGK